MVLSRGVAWDGAVWGCHLNGYHPERGGVLLGGWCPRGRGGVQGGRGSVGVCPGVRGVIHNRK